VSEEGVILEHEAGAAGLGREAEPVLVLEGDAAGIGKVEPAENTEQRRLAGTGGSEKGQECALLYFKAGAIQRRRDAEAPDQPIDFKH
jgi:hypothetical protein